MDDMNSLFVALQITALGMGLVFAAIVLLWWMMAVLTNTLKDKESASDSAGDSPVLENDVKAQAAAIAVTIALAEQRTLHAHPLSTPPTAIVSAWQLGMRTRQLSQKGAPIVRNPRKVG
jgi:Na+-transporting methylmalonyl-CoA/oxaloacetate decarboxylase gamma subunit